MESYPPVTKYMARKLVTFTPETDMRKAIEVILKKKISGCPVVDEKKNLIGMLSEVDCLKIIVEGPYNKEPARIGTVGDFMSTDIKTISSDKTILDAAYLFVKQGLRRLPVLENGELVGQISRSDILRAIRKMTPSLKHVPDSWRPRVPSISKHKDSQYTENS